MPELPEVETIARELAPKVRGARLWSIRLDRPDIVRGNAVFGNHPDALQAALNGVTVREVRRQGKRLMLDLSSGGQLVFHLGMTGQLQCVASGTECLPHTHLRIGVDGTDWELRFVDARRFGGVWLETGRTSSDGVGLSALGPDALTISRRGFVALLKRRRQVKALLLDQRAISGLGNIYVDESLYAAGLHPLTLASSVCEEDVCLLWRAMRRILRSAINAKGSTISDYRTTSGESGGFQGRHRVYGRTGRPCRRCRTPIVRLIAAGRSSHVCPVCQPMPEEGR